MSQYFSKVNISRRCIHFYAIQLQLIDLCNLQCTVSLSNSSTSCSNM